MASLDLALPRLTDSNGNYIQTDSHGRLNVNLEDNPLMIELLERIKKLEDDFCDHILLRQQPETTESK